MPASLEHQKRMFAHLEGQAAVANEEKLRRALQITSAWLLALTKHFGADQNMRATIRHEGEEIAEISLGEALDLADAALSEQREVA